MMSSMLRLGSGSWSRRTRGGLGAALGWAAGAGAAGHVATPELPRVGQRELVPQDTWRPRAGQRELEPQDTWWPRSCVVHAEVVDTRERVICMTRLLS
jgi:hypothetical protein